MPTVVQLPLDSKGVPYWNLVSACYDAINFKGVLHHLSFDQMVEVFSQVPPHIRTLNVESNALNRFTVTELTTLFKNLHPKCSTLFLGFNGLLQLPSSIFIPPGVKNVVFDSNLLRNEYENINKNFFDFPPTVESLGFKYTFPLEEFKFKDTIKELRIIGLERRTFINYNSYRDRLLSIIRSIPVTVSSLSLEQSPFNPLFFVSAASTSDLLRVLPPHVTKLNLNGLLFAASAQTKSLILGNVPATVLEISLENNKLFANLSLRDAERSINAFRLRWPGRKLGLHNNGLSTLSSILPFFLTPFGLRIMRGANETLLPVSVINTILGFLSPHHVNVTSGNDPYAYYSYKQIEQTIKDITWHDILHLLHLNPTLDLLRKHKQKFSNHVSPQHKIIHALNLYIKLYELQAASNEKSWELMRRLLVSYLSDPRALQNISKKELKTQINKNLKSALAIHRSNHDDLNNYLIPLLLVGLATAELLCIANPLVGQYLFLGVLLSFSVLQACNVAVRIDNALETPHSVFGCIVYGIRLSVIVGITYSFTLMSVLLPMLLLESVMSAPIIGISLIGVVLAHKLFTGTFLMGDQKAYRLINQHHSLHSDIDKIDKVFEKEDYVRKQSEKQAQQKAEKPAANTLCRTSKLGIFGESFKALSLTRLSTQIAERAAAYSP